MNLDTNRDSDGNFGQQLSLLVQFAAIAGLGDTAPNNCLGRRNSFNTAGIGIQ
jgi:hypothetical protein